MLVLERVHLHHQPVVNGAPAEITGTLKSSNKRSPPLKKDQFGRQFGDPKLGISKLIMKVNSKFSWKIPSPKKDMKKDNFFGTFLGGPSFCCWIVG